MSNFTAIPHMDSLDEVYTLMDMLAFHAQRTPEKESYLFEGTSVTYGEMWDSLNRIAGFLQTIGIGYGDRVLMVMPNGTEFFPAFYGVQRLGAIAVPLFPGSGPQRILKIIQLCQARALIVPSSTPDEEMNVYRNVLQLLNCEIYRFDTLDSYEISDDHQFVEVAPEDLAFLQYTSGSTGNSKGVQLSHRNLIANLRQMVEATVLTEDDVLVSWLPVYHDLGLILMTMGPFYIGAKLILMPTTLTSLGYWLELITQHRATFTAAPDIGYRLCVQQVRDPSKYDLSSLRIAINAAEPIRVKTIRDFEERFGIQNIIKPGYGLAEASVGVTYWGNENRPIKYDDRGFVSIGKPIPRAEVVIVKDGEPASPGEIGEIAFRSPSATRGYYNNPEANERLFWQDDFLFSGDLGYYDEEGDVFIVSRKKNMIKQGGRSLAPREIEEVVDGVPRIRYSAAIGVDRGRQEGEQAYVFAETRLADSKVDEEGPRLVREIVQQLYRNLGFRPGRVYLIKPHTIPFTYNGKIQHSKLHESYMAGELAEQGLLIYPKY